MGEQAFSCVGFTPKRKGAAVNCGNCENWKNASCSVRAILDELYEESPKFRAYDMMMRTNRGINYSSS
ncbi:hypothetical protein DEAC_c17180 [Desulfosporosinus acididurans]|uniref:Uncharacterized protein n=1 Tax=Desulfosporosinus acididurans TaxID=476652 RepID=A0A0J1FS64_9FIRM|nr:hypothetical protein DEAC_c17180 [Desulfosporosinus acididurans]